MWWILLFDCNQSPNDMLPGFTSIMKTPNYSSSRMIVRASLHQEPNCSFFSACQSAITSSGKSGA